MKKIFTLIATALVAVSVNAQEEESYEAAPGGVIATEFASVVGEGGIANNVVDGKSVVTIKTTNVTCEAVGGTTPANVEGSGAQQITPWCCNA